MIQLYGHKRAFVVDIIYIIINIIRRTKQIYKAILILLLLLWKATFLRWISLSSELILLCCSFPFFFVQFKNVDFLSEFRFRFSTVYVFFFLFLRFLTFVCVI